MDAVLLSSTGIKNIPSGVLQREPKKVSWIVGCDGKKFQIPDTPNAFNFIIVLC